MEFRKCVTATIMDGEESMSIFLYRCNKCHIVLANPNIPPGVDYGYGPDIIEAWCPVCDG